MDWKNRITIDPEKRGGKPCIRGLRMTVYDVLEYLASGMSEEDILKDFPDLTREDIRACLEAGVDSPVVKLLFDQNLSHRLVQALQKEFPDSRHVREVGLQEATDIVVWQYAMKQGIAIVTKDADFHQRSFLFGHPPKVIWVRVGNASTAKIEALLRRRAHDVGTFGSDPESAFLILD
jgi:predicted nuclease of predicted toxin-antitoxin system/uncharacterized protein (DUF433 family)